MWGEELQTTPVRDRKSGKMGQWKNELKNLNSSSNKISAKISHILYLSKGDCWTHITKEETHQGGSPEQPAQAGPKVSAFPWKTVADLPPNGFATWFSNVQEHLPVSEWDLFISLLESQSSKQTQTKGPSALCLSAPFSGKDRAKILLSWWLSQPIPPRIPPSLPPASFPPLPLRLLWTSSRV